MNVAASAPTQDAGPDPAWDRLYQAGGISAALFVVLLVAAIALSIVSPPPPTTGGATTLEYIAEHRPMYIIHQQLWMVPGVFGAIVYLALYMALKHVHRSYAAMGAVVGGLAWALTLAMPTTSTGAPALVYLSDQYAATTDAGQRAAFVAAAESLIALNRTPTVVGVLTTIGMLIVSLVMLRGVFPRTVAYLGIFTAVLGIISEALRPVIEGGYGVYGVLLLVWMGAVGWRLYRLGSDLKGGSHIEAPTAGQEMCSKTGECQPPAASALDPMAHNLALVYAAALLLAVLVVRRLRCRGHAGSHRAVWGRSDSRTRVCRPGHGQSGHRFANSAWHPVADTSRIAGRPAPVAGRAPPRALYLRALPRRRPIQLAVPGVRRRGRVEYLHDYRRARQHQRRGGAHAPARSIGVVLIGVGLLATTGLLVLVIPALGDPASAGALLRGRWIVDFTLGNPVLLIGGVLLWRRTGLGYASAAALLFLSGENGVAFAVGGVLGGLVTATPIEATVIAVHLAIAAVCMAFLGFFLRSARWGLGEQVSIDSQRVRRRSPPHAPRDAGSSADPLRT